MIIDLIDVLMPTKEGRFIPRQVLQGLLDQRVPFRLWISTVVSNGDHAKARNHIKQYAHSKPYVLMLDNDIILPKGALNAMMRFLDAHEDFAAIALRKGQVPGYSGRSSDELIAEEPEHVDMSCVLFRTVELKALTFGYPGSPDLQKRSGCECIKACQDIRAGGKRIGFLQGIIAGHLYDTEFSSLSRLKRRDWR